MFRWSAVWGRGALGSPFKKYPPDMTLADSVRSSLAKGPRPRVPLDHLRTQDRVHSIPTIKTCTGNEAQVLALIEPRVEVQHKCPTIAAK